MKHILFILALLIGSSISYAELIRQGNTFVEQSVNEQDIELPYTYKDKSGKVYQLFISKNGAIYIIKISKKTGKPYKQYLPKEEQEKIKMILL